MRWPSARGFSLIEALVASALVAGAVVGLAHLVGIGVAQSAAARRTTMALVLAQSKLEELRAQSWSFAPDGSRTSSSALSPSPPSSLTSDQEGWTEGLDRFGAPSAPDGALHYRRRWAVTPWPLDDPDTLIVQVCVFPPDAGNSVAAACVFTIRTRKP